MELSCDLGAPNLWSRRYWNLLRMGVEGSIVAHRSECVHVLQVLRQTILNPSQCIFFDNGLLQESTSACL